MQVSAWHIYNPGSTTNRSITGLHKTEHLGLAGEESEWTRLFRKALSSVSVCLWVWSPPGTRPGDGCQPSHTQMSSLCSLIIRSDTPWVFFTTSSYPCVFWPCFARSHGVRMCVCVCVTLTKHWFLFLSAVGSAARHLYCFASLSQRAESQTCSMLGNFPILLSCFTLPHPSAQMAEPWKHSHGCITQQDQKVAKI